MSVEQNKVVVRRYYDELWNKGNVEVASELLHPDAVLHDPTSSTPVPLAQISSTLIPAERRAFKDLHFAIQEMIGEGDRVAVRHVFSGIHDGVYMGYPPTGAKVSTPGMGLHRLKDGKIVESWMNLDDLGLRKQLGIIS